MRVKHDFSPVTIVIESETELKTFKNLLREHEKQNISSCWGVRSQSETGRMNQFLQDYLAR